eukprot:TRINITY_DN108931_c0_g1_i1.p1 TRINITY_DN108931_c0_g1~~TRINITY_DN108931_c0_g1_i1.p1  ORF type:complete len:355 (-),score=49.68 TRINITY_DN108931_c0_g1_i1:257-1321(-)
MTSLLRLLEANQVDAETIDFLIEAVSNADDIDQQMDVLEPFLPENTEEARALLIEDPGTVKVCAEVLQVRELERQRLLHPNADSPLLQWAIDGLKFCDTYIVTRISWLCKEIRPFTFVPHIWEVRLRPMCGYWHLPYEEDGQWREQFFDILRPRWDGVYISHCGYQRKIRPGASMTDHRTTSWVSYRRYLRLCPPDEDGKLKALFLQDAADQKIALQVVMGLDPSVHVASVSQSSLANPGCPPAPHKGLQATKDVKTQLASRTMSADYEFREGHVFLAYSSDVGQFDAKLKVNHYDKHNFSEQLDWIDYTLNKDGDDPVNFDLGRNDWGNPRDPTRDHFPVFTLYAQSDVEHLL